MLCSLTDDPGSYIHHCCHHVSCVGEHSTVPEPNHSPAGSDYCIYVSGRSQLDPDYGPWKSV